MAGLVGRVRWRSHFDPTHIYRQRYVVVARVVGSTTTHPGHAKDRRVRSQSQRCASAEPEPSRPQHH